MYVRSEVIMCYSVGGDRGREGGRGREEREGRGARVRGRGREG